MKEKCMFKKLFETRCLLLILATVFLLVGNALAENMDYANMSDEELHQIISLASEELSRRADKDKKTILIDQDGILLYLTGQYTIEHTLLGQTILTLNTIMENNSAKNISIGHYMSSINDWDVDFSSIDINASPGHKIKGSISFDLDDANISMYEEIKMIELELCVFDTSSYDTIIDTEVIRIDPYVLVEQQ